MKPGSKAAARFPRLPSRVWTPILAILLLSSCERTPSKSDYVSARVTEMCRGRTSEALQSCRIAVIKQFSDMPFEEMKRRYPPPPPRPRPSCEIF